jgi:hypothetical protein
MPASTAKTSRNDPKFESPQLHQYKFLNQSSSIPKELDGEPRAVRTPAANSIANPPDLLEFTFAGQSALAMLTDLWLKHLDWGWGPGRPPLDSGPRARTRYMAAPCDFPGCAASADQ